MTRGMGHGARRMEKVFSLSVQMLTLDRHATLTFELESLNLKLLLNGTFKKYTSPHRQKMPL
jgi:hypothetical protein